MLELQEKLVYSIIKKYSNPNNINDLFQVGMVGAINAYNNYDKSMGVKYSTFAYKYILGEVLKYLREDRLIRLSRDTLNSYKELSDAKDYFYKTYGIVDDDKLCKVLKITKARLNEVNSYNYQMQSLNNPINNSEELYLEDVVNDKNINIENEIILKDALDSLNTDERKLIYDRYYNNLTQTEIAKLNNTSQVKVYRLERKILDKLKDKMT